MHKYIAMIKPKDSQDAILFSRVFAVLADPNRLLILKALGNKEKSVNQIAIELGLSQPLVSHHLAALKAAGLAISKKAGSFVFYRISTEKISGLIESMENVFEDIAKNSEIVPFQTPLFFSRGRRGRRWM